MVFGVFGCSTTPRPIESKPAAKARTPGNVRIDVRVSAHKMGASLNVEVLGKGIVTGPRPAFENPRNWDVQAETNGLPLRRVLNGPARVERAPISRDEWEVTISFARSFAVPKDLGDVEVKVRPPGQSPTELTLPISEEQPRLGRR